jgi:MFS family permease
MHAITRNKLLLATFIMTLLYALHYGIPLYATSSFLATYFSSTTVSALYVAGSILTLLVSLRVTRYIRRYHTYHFTVGLVLAEIAVTLLFALSKNPLLIGLFFVLHFCIQAMIYIILNIFIETFTKHAETGAVRGIFLTLLNLGILIAPLIGGTFLSREGFEALYIVASLALIPFLYFLHGYMKHVRDPAYHTIDMLEAAKRAWRNKNLRGALVAMFLLESFYAVMVIYSPIYITSLGIPLAVYLSVIMPIALIPLILLPYELGRLADKRYGEKEILIIGLLVMVLSLLAIIVTESSNVLVWVGILLFSRIGAACTETMIFTYFFKKVDAEDVSLTALFGNIRSLATISIAALGVLVSPILVSYPGLMFLLLALMILYGITYIIPIKDTR